MSDSIRTFRLIKKQTQRFGTAACKQEMPMKKKKKTGTLRFPVRKINKTISKKLVGLFLVVMLALVGLTVRITVINASNGDEYRRIVLQNTQQQYVNRTLAFKRGDILDRNGTILATSERVYNLILDCRVANYEDTDEEGRKSQPYIEETVAALIRFFGLDEDELYLRLRSEETKNSQYQIIKKNVTMEEKEAFEAYINPTEDEIKKLPDDELLKRYRVQGVWFEETYLRVYPQNSIACDLIGFCNSSNEAAWGIEGYYSEVLNGVNGRAFGYFNADANVEQTIIQPEDGNTVISTCDVNIQQIVRKAIEDFQVRYSDGPNGTKGAKNVAVLVMDPNNGEVLAMDSSDWYDLNNPRDLTGLVDELELEAMSEEEKIEKMNAIWRNYCISDAFEPGSTAKPFTVSAALSTDSVKTTDHYFCDGYETIRGLMVRCSEYPDYHGDLDVAGGLINSCNDVLMQIGKEVGAQEFLRYQEIFNFGLRTGIDLPGENSGILYTEDTMGELELATASFGQGFTCTMIQEAAAMSSLINGGYYYKPHVVRSITDSEGNLLENKNSVMERQTVSSEVSDFIRETLGNAAKYGTGQEARVPGYSIGGKTGTAQKIPRASGKYLVSFIGFAPVEDPQVLVYVIVDEPNALKQDSSSYAQQIAKQIFTELLPYMNIFVTDTEELAAAKAEEEYLAYLRELEEEEARAAAEAEAAYEEYLRTLEAEEAETAAQAAAEAAAAEAAAQAAAQENEAARQQSEAAEAAAALGGGPADPNAQENRSNGVEYGVPDTTIPAPPAAAEDETVLNGGNDIYSEGVENEGY